MATDPYLLRVVDKSTLQTIHEQSLELLGKAGVIFDSEEVIRRFVDKGQKVEGRRVYLSESLILDALESVPKTFTMKGRVAAADVCIGVNQQKMVVAPGNGTLFIQELMVKGEGQHLSILTTSSNCANTAAMSALWDPSLWIPSISPTIPNRQDWCII